MIAVVTGASGFVGQNLVRRLRRDGHEVRCLIRPGGGGAPPGASRHVVRYHEPSSLFACKALEGAHVVFHLAAATKAHGAEAFHAANVTPTRHLLGAILARRLFPRFVFVSSQAAAGPAPDLHRPVVETDPPRPVEPYGRSKLEAERIVESFADRVPVTILRPGAVFGPHDRDFLPLFRLASRGVILYPGVADHWFSVLHVDDLLEALLAAATKPEAISQTYFIGGDNVRWREFGEHIASAVGRTVRHLNIPSPLVHTASVAGELWSRVTRRPTLANLSKAAMARQKYWVCSASRVRESLGVGSSRSLPEAVRRTYYWYRQNGWLRGSSGAGGAVA
ncbi:MAG: NAD-dependent epimerase/dehydratase family protein [Gemmatimonadaceae bacterium]